MYHKFKKVNTCSEKFKNNYIYCSPVNIYSLFFKKQRGLLPMFYCNKEFVGKTIQQLRKKAGIKQNELAEKIGISEKHLSKIETGKNYPSLDNFLKMAEILNFDLENFGIKNKQKSDPLREEFLRIAYSATDSDIKDYLEIIAALKKILKNK